MGRTLVMLFMLINLILCFYIAYQLFRTADYLANTVKALALVGVTPPDFYELKALGIYVFLLGISGFALAYWVDADRRSIEKLQKLTRTRKSYAKPPKQEYPKEIESQQIVLLECPECGEELSPNFELCPNCGYELKPISCPKCGKQISRDFSLCPYCGIKLKSAD